ncbi:hypothetical protein CW702_02140 [Candidatus Bathyarchaeota archaeon]|nr:MAG: hypothetical protein CW702_02140 [Candidatus Bathyarchaeota archaeon]
MSGHEDFVIRWENEVVIHERFEITGSQLFQVTSAPVISNNIYCEQSYCTPDGERFAFIRVSYDHGMWSTSLWVCDVPGKRIAMVEPNIEPGVANCKYTGIIYYIISKKGQREIVRLSLENFEKETVFDMSGVPLRRIQSVSPDQRYAVGTYIPLDKIKDGRATPQIIKLDFKTGEWFVIHENVDIINTHLQYEPSKGKDILVQHNRGALLDRYGNIIRLVGEEGATLYVIDDEGKNYRQLPVGKPYTNPVTGHECWIGDTGEVLLTTVATLKEAMRNGNVLAVKPGDKRARIVSKGYLITHISASKDGKFFVGDILGVKGRPIVVGSIETGKSMILCLSGSSRGRSQFSHPHPYMTGDNRWVVFNSDKTGIPQVYLASVPTELLESLT